MSPSSSICQFGHLRTPWPTRPVPDHSATCPDCGERVARRAGKFLTIRELDEIGRREREVVPRSEAEALAEALEEIVRAGDDTRGHWIRVAAARGALGDFRSRHPKETP